MYLRNLAKLEEEKMHQLFITKIIAEMIYIHYKYYKNNEFESYEQMYNSSMQKINYSAEEQEKIYKNVDSLLEKEHNLFFAHNNKSEPIFLVDLLENESKGENCETDL